MDANGVLAAVFDPANSCLNLTTVAGTPSGSPIRYDENGVWAGAYDSTTNTLRVVRV